MKISLNLMKQFGGQGLDTSIDELVQRIGAQLGAVEEVENLGTKYQGVVVAKVVTCDDHPNADRLHVCTIDDGGITPDVKRDANGYVQVVCGAPNVRAGLMVAWLPPGSTVPESVGGDPFVLEARELRGVVSNGMLASAKELALGDSHEGLLELDDSAKPGDDFATAYGLDDYVIDIENKMFTHRPDCFGQLGVAREIAGISGLKFSSPAWYTTALPVAAGEGLPLTIENELPGLVPRFVALTLKNVAIKPSPVWLQTYLLRLGVRPISNVVDITNYMMLVTGQPMHAYDYDKVKALDNSDTATLVVRNPRSQESLALLNGKTIEPRAEAIMIATKSQLIGLGGIMGGSVTEVSDTTKNIILECANFDMYSIRRSSMAHGIFTDAVTRFNKGQSPLQNDEVLAKAVEMLQELAGAEPAGPVIDDNHVDVERRSRRWVHPPVPITSTFVNARLGFDLSAEQMKTLLENVEFSVEVDGENLIVTTPFWRTDVETREDVVEEIGRLYGFDHLPLELPKRRIVPAHKDPAIELKATVRNVLSRAGANEVLTYSFVHGDLLDKVGQDKSQAYSLSNALSPDLQYYRLSLTPSLLATVHANIKAGYDSFGLFELGKAHIIGQVDDEGLPTEFDRLAFVYAASARTKSSGAAYYHAKRYLLQVLAQFGLDQQIQIVPLQAADSTANAYYEPSRAATIMVGEQVLGQIGEYKAAVRKKLKLPEQCAGFELSLKGLQATGPLDRYTALPRFPKISQDITLKVATDVAYRDLYDLVVTELQKAKPEQTLLSVRSTAIFQREDDPDHKQITLRISLANYVRTLTDQEVTKLLDAISELASQKLKAERI